MVLGGCGWGARMAEATRTHRVVVVGAGVAGLVSALMLACRGLQVTLVERAETPGGKMRQVMVDGAAIDSGPTVFTMRWVFDQIFEAAGTSLEQQLRGAMLDTEPELLTRYYSREDVLIVALCALVPAARVSRRAWRRCSVYLLYKSTNTGAKRVAQPARRAPRLFAVAEVYYMLY